MSTFEIKKFAISSIGAIALSATCVLAAIGPVRAANAPLTTSDWQQAVTAKVSSDSDAVAARMRPGQVAETMLALHFTAAGDYAGAAVSRTSGNAAIDRHALAIADHVAYPALPAGFRGRPQTVMLRLAFGGEQEVARQLGRTGKVSVDVASAARNGGTQIAPSDCDAGASDFFVAGPGHGRGRAVLAPRTHRDKEAESFSHHGDKRGKRRRHG